MCNENFSSTQVFIPIEKKQRYTLYVLDRYQKKLHILDPKETSPENEEKEENECKKNKERFEKKTKKIKFDYHSHRNKIVSFIYLFSIPFVHAGVLNKMQFFSGA